MSLLSVVLLVLAALAVLGAEWPRLAQALRLEGSVRLRRHAGRTRAAKPAAPGRAPRKGHLRVVRDADADDFVASVRRDLDRLPTVDRDKDG